MYDTPQLGTSKWPLAQPNTDGMSFGKKDTAEDQPMTSYREYIRDFKTSTSRGNTGRKFTFNSARTDALDMPDSEQGIREKFDIIWEILAHYGIYQLN